MTANQWLRAQQGGTKCIICGNPRDGVAWYCAPHRRDWAAYCHVSPLNFSNYGIWALGQRIIWLIKRLPG